MRLIYILSALVPAVLATSAPAVAQAPGACFYEHANFQGRRMCINVGQNVPMLDMSMNDQLSSVQLAPGIRITICEHANFAGRCIPLDRSIGNFQEIGLNDRVSSIAVEGGVAGPAPAYGGGGYAGGQPRPPSAPQYTGGSQRGWDDQREQMVDYRAACDRGDRRACVQFGVALGRSWERRSQWRQTNPDFFWWER